jgi:circadian clock protein KaiC
VIDTYTSSQTGPAHVPTGVPGLDAVLKGGLLPRAVYIVQGGPGEGKTILANQICYSWAARGERSLYVTLLAETHHRLLRHLQNMAFMDNRHAGTSVVYESAFDILRSDGLEGVLRYLTRNGKRQEATLIVIDGLFALEENAASERAFREFINDLSVYADMVDCTILLLTNSKRDSGSPEFTMVDGWLHLGSDEDRFRTYRYLQVRKFRGSDFISGRHMTSITSDGFRVFPRLEAVTGDQESAPMRDQRLSTGVSGLDHIIRGGIPYSSTTLLVGPTGVGKTTLGLSFICESSEEEPGLVFGFYEDAHRLRRRASALGLDLGSSIDRGVVEVIHRSPTEFLQDQLAEEILEAVRHRGVKRLFIDGVDAFKQAAINVQRLGRFFSTLTAILRCEGVTTIFTAELAEIVGGEHGLQFPAVSAIAENILLLRYAELESRLYRTLTILKMRESGFEPYVYEFTLGAEGFRLGERMQRTEGVVVGRPHRQPPSGGEDV